MSVPFSQYAAWLASDEYKAQIDRLVGQPNTPARDDYPLDVSHLVTMHGELGDQLIRAAAHHFKEANRLLEEAEDAA